MESHDTAAAVVVPLHHYFTYFKPAIQKDRASDIKAVRSLIELYCNRVLKPIIVVHITPRELALFLAVESNQKIRHKILEKLIKQHEWTVLKQVLRFLAVAERVHLLDVVWKQIDCADPAIAAGVFHPLQLLAEFLMQEKRAEQGEYHFQRIILLYNHRPQRRIFILRHFLFNVIDKKRIRLEMRS